MLSLAENKLQLLPDNMDVLQSLTILNMEGNSRFREIPRTLGMCSSLKKVNISLNKRVSFLPPVRHEKSEKILREIDFYLNFVD